MKLSGEFIVKASSKSSLSGALCFSGNGVPNTTCLVVPDAITTCFNQWVNGLTICNILDKMPPSLVGYNSTYYESYDGYKTAEVNITSRHNGTY